MQGPSAGTFSARTSPQEALRRDLSAGTFSAGTSPRGPPRRTFSEGRRSAGTSLQGPSPQGPLHKDLSARGSPQGPFPQGPLRKGLYCRDPIRRDLFRRALSAGTSPQGPLRVGCTYAVHQNSTVRRTTRLENSNSDWPSSQIKSHRMHTRVTRQRDEVPRAVRLMNSKRGMGVVVNQVAGEQVRNSPRASSVCGTHRGPYAEEPTQWVSSRDAPPQQSANETTEIGRQPKSPKQSRKKRRERRKTTSPKTVPKTVQIKNGASDEKRNRPKQSRKQSPNRPKSRKSVPKKKGERVISFGKSKVSPWVAS